jgi:DNA-binding NarL/FixJ family response regulator
MTKILIVDDHALFRLGVRHILSAAPEFQIVGEESSARAAFSLLDSERPDVVLMDVSLPGMDGVVATREIKRRAGKTRVLMLTVHDQIHDVLDALNAGATGYALKTEGPDALIRALRMVARGERYLAPELATRLAAYETRGRQANDVLAVLSEREREIFRMAAECLLTREIARELCISRKTVDTHLYRIHRKLGVRTAAELVRLAANMGMLHSAQGRDTQVAAPADPEPEAGDALDLPSREARAQLALTGLESASDSDG